MTRFLVTGAAGFIGFHLTKRLLDRGDEVVGLDDLNDYYDVSLKEARLAQLTGREGFQFVRLNVADREGMQKLFESEQFEKVVHLAAQAGVRYSLENPHAYIDANVVGFTNILEGCRHSNVAHLVYASSSSVYGANTKVPFAVEDNVDHPVSLYAATKKANELMAHTYSHLFGLPTTGLRFFTVYGPWGRPDMAIFMFVKAILSGQPINVFNHGKMQRDFTYIDDIVEGVVRTADRIPVAETDEEITAAKRGCYRVYNIGNHNPVELMYLIECIEKQLGQTAEKNMMPMQLGDVPATCAEISQLQQDVGFAPDTPIEVGLKNFIAWYREYFQV